MENNREHFQESQQGTGSAENQGRNREDQMNKSTDISNKDQQNIASQIGESSGSVSDLRHLGALSGRDDLSEGGNMENENTGEKTDR